MTNFISQYTTQYWRICCILYRQHLFDVDKSALMENRICPFVSFKFAASHNLFFTLVCEPTISPSVFLSTMRGFKPVTLTILKRHIICMLLYTFQKQTCFFSFPYRCLFIRLVTLFVFTRRIRTATDTKKRQKHANIACAEDIFLRPCHHIPFGAF